MKRKSILMTKITIALLTFSIWIGGSTCALCQKRTPLQHAWEIDPDLGEIWVFELPPPSLGFDLEQLRSNSEQDRVDAARKICRSHDNPLFKERAEALKILLERIQSREESTTVRRAMVSAALLVSDGKEAKQIWDLGSQDPLTRPLIEGRLIEWKNPTALELWRTRIQNPSTSHGELRVALEGIAILGSQEKDQASLIALLKSNSVSESNRFLAATALGQLCKEGLNPLAKEILESDAGKRYLLAAAILARHRSPETLVQLAAITEKGDASAQRMALQGILEQAPDTARGKAEVFLGHSDSELRRTALKAMQTSDEAQFTRLQGQLLSDKNVSIRKLATELLLEKSDRGQRAIVDEIITAGLDSEAWEAKEQAIVMVVELKDLQRMDRLLKLLRHSRPEVNMHAAWALMELAKEPEVLDQMHEFAKEMTARLVAQSDPYVTETDRIELSFLFEAFGKNHYQPAKKTLVQYIPKNFFRMGNVSRASAIWALGKLHQGVDVPELRRQLEARVTDRDIVMPEDQLVRFSCVLAFGEMGFSDCKPVLESLNEGDNDPITIARTWTFEKLSRSPQKK